MLNNTPSINLNSSIALSNKIAQIPFHPVSGV